MNSNKVAVVIPVYNVEGYLKRCLNSIVSQTHSNLEIILVDDGSTDGSGRICEEFALNDKRIKVVHKPNGGLSDARNTGIAVAKAKYITFVDSDDYIHLRMVEELYKSLTSTDANIATCQYSMVYESGKSYNKSIKSEEAKIILSGDCALIDLLYEKHTTNTSCAKLYERKLFKHITFPVGYKYEDLGTTYKLFSESKKVVFTNFSGYYYFQRDGSIINRKFDPDRMDGLRFAKEQLCFIEKYKSFATDAAKNRLFREAVKILQLLKDSEINSKVFEKSCLDEVYLCRKRVLYDSRSSFNTRLHAAISFISPTILILLLSLRTRSIKR